MFGIKTIGVIAGSQAVVELGHAVQGLPENVLEGPDDDPRSGGAGRLAMEKMGPSMGTVVNADRGLVSQRLLQGN